MRPWRDTDRKTEFDAEENNEDRKEKEMGGRGKKNGGRTTLKPPGRWRRRPAESAAHRVWGDPKE